MPRTWHVGPKQSEYGALGDGLGAPVSFPKPWVGEGLRLAGSQLWTRFFSPRVALISTNNCPDTLYTGASTSGLKMPQVGITLILSNSGSEVDALAWLGEELQGEPLLSTSTSSAV